MKIRFDDSLPALAKLIANEFDKRALSQGVVIRDITGRLMFVLPKEIDSTRLNEVSTKLKITLGAYARNDCPLMDSSGYGAADFLSSSLALNIKVGKNSVRLIDRRLVGADWLRAPTNKALGPPRFVFASLKGGVGRSTALTIAAAHLASAGKRVLAIDLDMEAPGLGSLLLDKGTLPEFGLIDALVENGMEPLDDGFFADLFGPSNLTAHQGRIHVIPSFGRRSISNPGEILSKLARAYTEDIRPDGSSASILDQISEIVDHFSESGSYDAILIDARAGLHETTATAILGLGAEVFLFGLNEPQTFQGYSALLSHLARFANLNGLERPEWISRISMVQGKAPLEAKARQEFADKCLKLFTDSGLEKTKPKLASKPRSAALPFSNVPWDDDQSDDDVLPSEMQAFREPVAIFNNEQFMQFDPLSTRDLLSEETYMSTFKTFLNRIGESFTDIKRIEDEEI